MQTVKHYEKISLKSGALRTFKRCSKKRALTWKNHEILR